MYYTTDCIIQHDVTFGAKGIRTVKNTCNVNADINNQFAYADTLHILVEKSMKITVVCVLSNFLMHVYVQCDKFQTMSNGQETDKHIEIRREHVLCLGEFNSYLVYPFAICRYIEHELSWCGIL